MNEIAWGNAAEWLTAVITAAGFAVGLRLLSRQLKAHEAADEEHRIRFAVGVGAWLESSGEGVFVQVRNSGPAPIYDVRAIIEFSDGSRNVDLETVGPESTRALRLDEGTPLREVDAPVGIEFTDSAGTRWMRHSQGRLEAIGIRRFDWDTRKVLNHEEMAKKYGEWL